MEEGDKDAGKKEEATNNAEIDVEVPKTPTSGRVTNLFSCSPRCPADSNATFKFNGSWTWTPPPIPNLCHPHPCTFKLPDELKIITVDGDGGAEFTEEEEEGGSQDKEAAAGGVEETTTGNSDSTCQCDCCKKASEAALRGATAFAKEILKHDKMEAEMAVRIAKLGEIYKKVGADRRDLRLKIKEKDKKLEEVELELENATDLIGRLVEKLKLTMVRRSVPDSEGNF